MLTTHTTQSTPQLLDQLTQRQQKLAHLQKANSVRTRRADIRRRLSTGEIRLADVITDEAVQSMPVVELVKFSRGWGTSRACQMLNRLKISEQRQIRMLSPRQQNILARQVH